MRVFIASPGDVADERDITSHVVAESNRIFGNPFGVQLEPVRWETHAWPDVGDDAQNVINKQIREFDVLVGIMWKRFGSPTKRAKSGTGEEFDRAYQLFKKYGRPKIMFYFRITPFYTTDLKEISQFRKVAEFRRKLERLGVLYWNYDTPLEFERNVREHLIRQILQHTENIRQRPAEKEKPRRRPLSPERIEPYSIFLAYSHRDKDAVREVYRALKAAGHRPWLDEQNLVPGQMWHNEVDRAIRQTDVMLLLFSSNSELQRGFVAKEIELATRMLTGARGPILISVRLDHVEPPTNLRQLTWVDYFLPDGPERLIEAINGAVEARKRQQGN